MIAGKYEHEKNEGLKEFVIALGIGADFADKADGIKSTLDFSQNGNSITIKTIYTNKEENLTFTIGEEFDDSMPNGEKLKSTASLDGNILTIKSKKDGAEQGFRSYEFTATHVIMNMHANATGKTAKRFYKKV